MIKITQEQFNKAKEKAFKHYEKHKKVISPLLGEIKVDGFDKLNYVSIVPAWKSTKYGPQLYIEDFEI